MANLSPGETPQIHVLSHSLHYGLSVFEGVRCYQTRQGAAIFRLAEHTKRLFQSAHIMGMALPFSQDEINQAQIDAVRKNNLSFCYIRPLAFYGAHALSIHANGNPVHIIVAAWPWGAYLGEEGLKNGIRVKTSSYVRHHVNAAMCRAKVSGHYANSILSRIPRLRTMAMMRLCCWMWTAWLPKAPGKTCLSCKTAACILPN